MHTRFASLLPVLLLAFANACAAGTQGAPKAPAVPDAQGVYDVKAVDVMPRLLNTPVVTHYVETSYPPLLRDAGVGGQVRLRVVIGPDGIPADIAVFASSHFGFHESAITAVRMMRFSPGQVGGRAVPVRVELPVTYELMP